ncbi:BPSS1780 family membrane protein [Niveibacterium sp. SC-1]|uniref:BPSS1780 family membrane protein n=1 Tax=Niveibacterium sp. SC-1 TaxID=3135646 RepID=UPI00311E73EB
MSTNPYAPPGAAVSEAQEPVVEIAQQQYIPGGQTIAAGRGWSLFLDAWRLLRKRFFKCLGVALVIVVAMIPSFGFVPYGNLISQLIFPVFVAGFGACVARLRREGDFPFATIFLGWRIRTNALLGLGVFNILWLCAQVALLVGIFGEPGLLGLLRGDMTAVAGLYATLGSRLLVLQWVLTAIGGSAMFFAPYLVLEQGLSVTGALRASFTGCLRNLPAGIVAVFAYFVWAIVATLALLLGWLALIPCLFMIGHLAYRDIFYRR